MQTQEPLSPLRGIADVVQSLQEIKTLKTTCFCFFAKMSIHA